MITLYRLESSPFVDKVERVLRYKGLDFASETLSIADYKARESIHPSAKCPLLEHDGTIVGDSTQICLYLEETFPEPALIPSNRRSRGLCMMLEDWADESLYFHEMRLRITMPHNARRILPSMVTGEPAWMRKFAMRVIPHAVKMTLHIQGMGRRDEDTFIADIGRHLDSVESALSRSAFLVGNTLTLADIAVFAQVACILQSDEGDAAAAPLSRLRAWYKRVDELTA